MSSSQHGEKEFIKGLHTLSRRYDPAFESPGLLHRAIKQGYLNAVKFIVEDSLYGTEILETTKKGRFPVNIAAECGDLSIVKYIVENAPSGIKVLEKKDDNNFREFSAVLYAVEKGNLEMLEYIVEVAGPSILEMTSAWKRTTAMLAAERNNLEMLEYIVKMAGPSILEKVDKFGDTITHYCIFKKDIKMLKFIARNAASGSDLLTRKNNLGIDPLCFAYRLPGLNMNNEKFKFILTHNPQGLKFLDSKIKMFPYYGEETLRGLLSPSLLEEIKKYYCCYFSRKEAKLLNKAIKITNSIGREVNSLLGLMLQVIIR